MQFKEFLEKPKRVSEGENVTLPCVVRAFPIPSTAWKKDGELVTNGDRHIISFSNLTIKNVKRSDMGKYSCVAWNKGSVKAKSTLVLVTGKKCYFPKCNTPHRAVSGPRPLPICAHHMTGFMF